MDDKLEAKFENDYRSLKRELAEANAVIQHLVEGAAQAWKERAEKAGLELVTARGECEELERVIAALRAEIRTLRNAIAEQPLSDVPLESKVWCRDCRAFREYQSFPALHDAHDWVCKECKAPLCKVKRESPTNITERKRCPDFQACHAANGCLGYCTPPANRTEPACNEQCEPQECPDCPISPHARGSV